MNLIAITYYFGLLAQQSMYSKVYFNQLTSWVFNILSVYKYDYIYKYINMILIMKILLHNVGI